MVSWIDDEDTRISDFFVSEMLQYSSCYLCSISHQIGVDRECEPYIMSLTDLIWDVMCPLTQSIGLSSTV
jgi:hypothetical protein